MPVWLWQMLRRQHCDLLQVAGKLYHTLVAPSAHLISDMAMHLRKKSMHYVRFRPLASATRVPAAGKYTITSPDVRLTDADRA